MGLNDKQAEFTYTMAQFLVWCHENGFVVFGAELFRTPEQAAIYAKKGIGIKNSCHTKKLALDIFRMKNGKLTWAKEDYRDMGDKWESMHDLARWGGNFRRRDAVHFSFEHNGVK